MQQEREIREEVEEDMDRALKELEALTMDDLKQINLQRADVSSLIKKSIEERVFELSL